MSDKDFMGALSTAREALADIPAAIRERRCVKRPVGCEKPIEEFRDAQCAREFQMSGLCQTCQDKIFGVDD